MQFSYLLKFLKKKVQDLMICFPRFYKKGLSSKEERVAIWLIIYNFFRNRGGTLRVIDSDFCDLHDELFRFWPNYQFIHWFSTNPFHHDWMIIAASSSLNLWWSGNIGLGNLSSHFRQKGISLKLFRLSPARFGLWL